jgi:hypothetical protein
MFVEERVARLVCRCEAGTDAGNVLLEAHSEPVIERCSDWLNHPVTIQIRNHLDGFDSSVVQELLELSVPIPRPLSADLLDDLS